MVRVVPSVPLQNPGNIVASAIWNTGPKAMADFYTGPPIFAATTSTSFSTTSGAYSALTFNSAGLDSDSGHSNVTNTSRYTCQVAGWYLVLGSAVWNSSAAQFDIWAAVAKNGSVLPGTQQVLQKAPNDIAGINTEAFVQLGVNDYVEIWARQDSGGSLNTTNFAGLACSFNVLWIHS